MYENVKNILLDAIGVGYSLKIIYLGGSQAGSFRDVSPISIMGEKLRAKCHSSGTIKIFDINKIQIPNDTSGQNTPYGSVDNKIYETIQDVVDDFHTLYPESKWSVEFSDHNFELFDFFKNGKRKKSPFLVIHFMKIDESEIITEITFEITPVGVTSSERSRIPKTRPWVVGDPRNGGFRSYSTLHNAATVFFERLSLIASGVEGK